MNQDHGRRRARSFRLMYGAAASAITATLVAPVAYAQDDSSRVEEIVVTGTSIRGAAPVGQNLVQLDRQIIDRTAAVSVQDLLQAAAPQVNGFGSAAQAAGGFEPRLRSLGGLSSSATLVLVDGHRTVPGASAFNATSDPNIIPAGAVERVEILPDGASAIYGSDAVAGVINIITRKNYDGYEVSGQVGFADSYRSRTGNLVYGHSWDSGSVMATYGYNYASNLAGADRSFVNANQSNGPGSTGRGGSNFNNYACHQATFVPAAGQPGAGRVFQYPYTGNGLVNNTTLTGLCSNILAADLLPEVESHRLYVAVRQNIGDRVKLSGSILYSSQNAEERIPRGTVQNVAVFGPGSTPPGGQGQINPFFQGPPGVNRGTINFDFDELLGPGAKTFTKNEQWGATLAADIDLGREWMGSLSFLAAVPKSTARREDALCAPCALLAINGTTTTSGSPTQNQTAGPLGTATTVNRIPLTTANALDLWNLRSGNRTSQAVRDQLIDSDTFSYTSRPVIDMVAKIDGPLFDLPAGPVRAAVGGEYYILGRTNQNTASSPIGPASTSSSLISYEYEDRKVTSGFAEVAVPIVNAEMGVPFARSVDINISGRIDHYSDLADDAATTKNPKFGVNWIPVEGLTFRSSYGTSFTAPNHGQTQFAGNARISDYFTVTPTFILPEGYPNRAFLGCTQPGPCTVTAASGHNGVLVWAGVAPGSTAASPGLRPQTGRNFSLGADLRPTFLPGFHASVTFWKSSFRGIVTQISNTSQAAAIPGLEYLLVINPTQAQIDEALRDRPLETVINSPISFISSQLNYNMFNIRGKGVDFDVGYTFGTGVGTFTLGAVGEYKFDWFKQTGAGEWLVATNVANTSNAFSPLRFTGRANIGWSSGSWRGDLFANYTGAYIIQDSGLPYQNRPCPVPLTNNNFGCARVASLLTFDANLSYSFDGDGILNELQVYGNVRNLLDKDPPFVNSGRGYALGGGFSNAVSANTWANPIGRTVTVGLRKRW